MRLKAPQIADIPELVKEGLTYKEIAKRYSCGERTIAGWVRKYRDAGIEITNKRGVKALQL